MRLSLVLILVVAAVVIFITEPPSQVSAAKTRFPTKRPTTRRPSKTPSYRPTKRPSSSRPSKSPSFRPTQQPSKQPTSRPTRLVTNAPTGVSTPAPHPTIPPTATITFFNAAQSYQINNASLNSNTLLSEGYSIQYSQDKLWNGGLGGGPIGRFNYPLWPQGIHCQAVTTGVVGKAQFRLQRFDGKPFTINSMTLQLRANTAGAGGTFEITEQLNGVELNGGEPYYFDATGTGGHNFVIQSPLLSGADRYAVTLYVDFAIMNLQVTVD